MAAARNQVELGDVAEIFVSWSQSRLQQPASQSVGETEAMRDMRALAGGVARGRLRIGNNHRPHAGKNDQRSEEHNRDREACGDHYQNSPE